MQALKSRQAKASSDKTSHKGTLILDASASPANISYLTDTGLLNDARLNSETLIYLLYHSAPELWPTKPRTCRCKAHSQWLSFAKSRTKTSEQIKDQRKASLAYLKRNIVTINKMLDLLIINCVSLLWKKRYWKRLWVITELYFQQRNLYSGKKVESKDRILSLHQPHIRSIKRGKSGGRSYEFGAKYNAALADGFISLELVSFNNFNEVQDLQAAVRAYKAKTGFWPKVVLGDKIYFSK